MTQTAPRPFTADLAPGRFAGLEWGDPTSARALLLLHGFNQTAHSWEDVAPSLAAAGRRVVAFDQRGHGASLRAPDRDYSRETMIADVGLLADRAGLEAFALVGMSMGAVHALGFAAAHPGRVERLVVVDYAPAVERAGTDRIKLMMMRRWPTFDDAVAEVMQFNPRRSEDNVRARLAHTLTQQPDGYWTWKVDPAYAVQPRFHEPPDAMWEVISRVRCPTLLVRGADSDLLGRDAAERMVAALSDGRLATVPDAGHSVAGDNPEGFLAAVVAFLAPAPRGGEGA